MRTELDEAEKKKNEYLQSYQYWQAQSNKLQKFIDIKHSEFIASQAEMKILSQQLTDTKQILRDTQDQNKFLAEAKWLLVQEKSQLEGRLKQMQDSLVT